MIEIIPFQPYLADPDRVDCVATPPYDSMRPEERAAFSKNHPENFINAIRSIEEFPETDQYSLEDILQDNLHALEKLLEDGSFLLESEPALYVYELHCEDHTQTGIVAEVPLSNYGAGRIRGHEETRSDHEHHLYEYLNTVGANSSPICAAYRDFLAINKIISDITTEPAELDFTDGYGVRQKVWRISDREIQRRLELLFREIKVVYLTDGHHRIVSALRHAERRNGEHGVDGPWNYMMMALFPMEQMRILPFNRCIQDLGSLSSKDFLTRLAKGFSIEKCDPDQLKIRGPEHRGQFLMLLDHQCYRVTISLDNIPEHPVEALDVSLLQNLVFEPLLGVKSPRSDPRLGYVTGESGIDGLRDRSELGWRLSFACCPP